MYNYGLIGNCQTAALVSRQGSIDWLCMPRPDSPPVFGKLLDPDGGCFTVEGAGATTYDQEYLPNTNVLATTVTTADGSKFRITDFCPRFNQFGRVFRPISLFRIVEPIEGNPRVHIRCNPINGWEKESVRPVRGNSHFRYEIRQESLRLTTNMPLTYLYESTGFTLKEPLYFALTWGSAVEEDLPQVCRRFLDYTIDYWKTWVKHCSIPVLYQKEAIRSALALKLHCYEDTGAILAGLTTSLPEEVGHERNWDYRFCWLRDAYYVLTAFHNLGHFEETEGFLKFVLDIAERQDHSADRLRPVYRLDQSLPLPEQIMGHWAGFQNSKPVRADNQAAEHIQNDVYGETILALAPIFFDERFRHLRTRDHQKLLIHLGNFCAKNISQPDAGLWEIRDGWKEHSFSNLLCWAGLERLQRLHERGFLQEANFNIENALRQAEDAVWKGVKDGILCNGPTDPTLDAAMLQLPILRFPDQNLSAKTVDAIWRDLTLNKQSKSGYLYRYVRADDFGNPQSAFLICSFWLAQALAKVNRRSDGLKVMEEILASANHLGLFSEHFLPEHRLQSGNFPQAYSHVGLLNAAFALSPPWDQIL